LNANQTNFRGFKAPSIKFFNPLHTTINRIRGLYSTKSHKGLFVQGPTHPGIFKERENEAEHLITKGTKQLIAEKFLTLILGFISEGSFDNSDQNMIANFGILEDDLREIVGKLDFKKYQTAVDKLINQFDSIPLNTDFVICMPSVNYHSLMLKNNLLKKDKFPKKILRQVYDFDSYYHMFGSEVYKADSENKRRSNLNLLSELLENRADELEFLSYSFVFYSLSRRNPFIRTRNIPSQRIHQLAISLARYNEKMEERNKIKDFVKAINKISDHIRSALPEDLSKIILSKGNHIKVITDLPAEWIKLDKLPLCVEKRFSRIPITPGNGLVAHSNLIKSEYVLSKENTRILILNCLNPNDLLFKLGRNLEVIVNDQLKLINKKAIYKEIRNKEEFKRSIEENKPTILIYYGHGSYSEQDHTGKLEIRNESMEPFEIEQIQWKPYISILGACETQILHGTHMNVANTFLMSGSVSVLGTYFPIDGLHAFVFISGLIRNLCNTLIGESPEHFERWEDVLLQTYRSNYIFEVIFSMEKYLEKRGKKLETYIKKPVIEFFKYGSKNGMSYLEQLRNRNLIFKEIFSIYPELDKAFKSILTNNLLLPISLFYSSLGSPEKIKILRTETDDSLYDGVETNSKKITS
jgi:hypothetical protein